jgi:hypothetical protein
VFDITDKGRTRALDRHAEDTPGEGVSWKPSPARGPAGHLTAASDPPEAAPSAVHRKHRILVADDSLLMADRICDRLQEDGCSIVGPVGSLQAACALARTADFDGAVLDLKLGQDLCLPIAALLKARGIPFIVLGYPARLDVAGFEPRCVDRQAHGGWRIDRGHGPHAGRARGGRWPASCTVPPDDPARAASRLHGRVRFSIGISSSSVGS